jgi:hypothetical protein
MSRIFCIAAIFSFVVCATAPGRAQTPPPAAAAAGQPAASHQDFSGNWSLDRSISVNPAQINFTPAANSSRSQNRNRRGGFGGFGGGRGGFGGGGSRSSGGQSGAAALTDVERARLKAITDELKGGSLSLVIQHHDPNFVVSDALDHTQFFQTDASPTENHIADTTIPSSTHWDDARIVTESTVASQLTLVYTYTLLTASNQLVVRVDRKDGERLRPFSPDVKFVYNRARTPTPN